MSRAFLVVLCLAVCTAVAQAQTIVNQVDVGALGFGTHELRPVEADGDPRTEEWLAISAGAPRRLFQVIALAAGRLCAGRQFDPSADWVDPATDLRGAVVAVHRLGTRDILIVRETRQVSATTYQFGPLLRIVALERPPCA